MKGIQRLSKTGVFLTKLLKWGKKGQYINYIMTWIFAFLLLAVFHLPIHHFHHLPELLFGEYHLLYEWPSCFSGWDTIPSIKHLFFYINRLSNLELALEFVCPFVIREGAFYSNEVENLLASTVVADVSPNQLSISHNAPYLWFTLEQKFPLIFNNLFHF